MELAPDRLDDVYNAGDQILQTVKDVFNESGQTLPNREYLIAGAPAFDCDQVTVAFMGMGSGLPDMPAPIQCDNPRNASYTIDIVRSLPQGRGSKSSAPIVPSPEAIMETAKIQMRDAKLLADACERFLKHNFIPNAGSYSIIVGEASGFRQAVSAEILIAV